MIVKNLKRLTGILKVGKWVKLKGNTKRDKYASDEIVFNVTAINVSDHKKEEIIDDAMVKRVELHTHTMMSAMDAVCQVTKHGGSNY